VNGVAHAPAGAPRAVVRAIKAGNKLQDKPYLYGGGHRSFVDTAYDCSGTVSFALHGAKLLSSPLPSGSLMSWGVAGVGRWITVYANAGHTYMVIAGLRLDTSGTGGRGPRWQTLQRDPAGFVVRHPAGL
jgi:cell wall-associated NlpC family hydrolase